MKKICLTVVGIYILFLSAFSQATDTTAYKSEQLKLDEANLVSGYYNQQGDHSAVTGGIGTQKLSDVSNIIQLKFVKWNLSTNNKYSLNIEAGIDHHTAASQAYVSQTGASHPGGTRIYPSVNWEVEKANKLALGFGASYSGEYNYHSYGLNFLVSKTSKDDNRQVSFKGQAFFDQVTMIEPSELAPKATIVSSTGTTYTTASGNVISSSSREGHKAKIPTSGRNTFSGSLTLTQVVNKNFQVALVSDIIAQQGLLSLPFHRVYFAGQDSAKIESLPNSRFKIPIGLRLNYFLGDKIIFRTYYRYYTDNWGVKAHTASLEVPYKISPFLSISPFYRYYIQTAANYFAPYKEHVLTDQYYTSNYDLSAFTSQYVGINVRLMTKKAGMLNMIELRYGRYLQSTGLNANNVGLNLKFK